MADKTGMEGLLPILENLYLDYLAYRQIARTAEPEKWAVHLNYYRNAKRPQIARRFDEIAATLQSRHPLLGCSCAEVAQTVGDLLTEGMVS
jgi:hypothetical protein